MAAICPVLPGRSHPHDVNCSVLFCSSQQQTDHPHLLLQRATSPITSLPDLLFPLCWAQCSFLAGCTLIVALLAYLVLAETKHGFIYFFTICWEGRQWQHFVVNCLAMRGTIGMSYHRKAGKNRGRAYLFAESWPLCAHDVQFVEEILTGRGWWLWGLISLLGDVTPFCLSLSLSFCQGTVCLLAQKSVSCLLSRLLAIHANSAAPWVQWTCWVSRC